MFSKKNIIVLVLALGLSSVAGADDSKKISLKDFKNKHNYVVNILKLYDTNKDGFLNIAELEFHSRAHLFAKGYSKAIIIFDKKTDLNLPQFYHSHTIDVHNCA